MSESKIIGMEEMSVESTEQRLNEARREILEMAGKRSLAESRALLEKTLGKDRQERIRYEGVISEAATIEDIEQNFQKRGGKKLGRISEGAVTYLKIPDEAKIIATSDAHGSFDGLKKAMDEFTKRKEAGENVYFNFGGDVGSGLPQKIEINEAIAALRLRYGEAVTREAGNGDRRGASLVHGLATEMTEKFAPQLFDALHQRVASIIERYGEEKKMTKEEIEKTVKERGWLYNVVFGAQLLRAAREGGSEPIKPEDLNPIFLQKFIRGVIGLKEKEVSRVITVNVLKPLVEANKPLKKQDKVFNDALLGQAKDVFEYWKLQNTLYNEQPTYSIFETDKAVILASHSGYLENVDKFGEIVHDPVKQGKGVWARMMKDEKEKGKIQKYGEFIDYYLDDFGKFLGKFAPVGKQLIILAGHNHGNFLEKIPLFDRAGNKTGQEAIRAEVNTSSYQKRQPKFAVVDLAKAGTEPEKAIEYLESK